MQIAQTQKDVKTTDLGSFMDGIEAMGMWPRRIRELQTEVIAYMLLEEKDEMMGMQLIRMDVIVHVI